MNRPSLPARAAEKAFRKVESIDAQCLCGKVRLQIDTPVFWAWHDHTRASRVAHGAVYATYVGSWRKRFRILAGEAKIKHYKDKANDCVRSFCGHCGTPLFYERGHSPYMINIPRALFSGRTGREPKYHVGITELRDWAYTGESLVPLEGFPGVVWQRSAKKKPKAHAMPPELQPESGIG